MYLCRGAERTVAARRRQQRGERTVAARRRQQWAIGGAFGEHDGMGMNWRVDRWQRERAVERRETLPALSDVRSGCTDRLESGISHGWAHYPPANISLPGGVTVSAKTERVNRANFRGL